MTMFLKHSDWTPVTLKTSLLVLTILVFIEPDVTEHMVFNSGKYF